MNGITIEKKWIQISSEYFTAAVEIDNEKVIQAAPILKYMNGWSLLKVREHCYLKHWKFYHLDEAIEKNI